MIPTIRIRTHPVMSPRWKELSARASEEDIFEAIREVCGPGIFEPNAARALATALAARDLPAIQEPAQMLGVIVELSA